MIFIGILLKYLMLFNKIEIIKTRKYNVFTKNRSGSLIRRSLWEKIIGIEKESIASVNLRSGHAQCLSEHALFYLEPI